jgi:hypothetical protein
MAIDCESLHNAIAIPDGRAASPKDAPRTCAASIRNHPSIPVPSEQASRADGKAATWAMNRRENSSISTFRSRVSLAWADLYMLSTTRTPSRGGSRSHRETSVVQVCPRRVAQQRQRRPSLHRATTLSSPASTLPPVVSIVIGPSAALHAAIAASLGSLAADCAGRGAGSVLCGPGD